MLPGDDDGEGKAQDEAEEGGGGGGVDDVAGAADDDAVEEVGMESFFAVCLYFVVKFQSSIKGKLGR